MCKTPEYWQILSYVAKPQPTFSEVLGEMAMKRGMSMPQLYKAAHISMQKVSDHKKNSLLSRPDKRTIVSLIFALKATLEEANQLMYVCGHSLSKNVFLDRLVIYQIEHQDYNPEHFNAFLTNERVIKSLAPKMRIRLRKCVSNKDTQAILEEQIRELRDAFAKLRLNTSTYQFKYKSTTQKPLPEESEAEEEPKTTLTRKPLDKLLGDAIDQALGREY